MCRWVKMVERIVGVDSAVCIERFGLDLGEKDMIVEEKEKGSSSC